MSAAALLVLAVPAAPVPAAAAAPAGAVQNPDGSVTLTATAGGEPVRAQLTTPPGGPAAIGALESVSASIHHDSGGCTGSFELLPAEGSAFLGLSTAAPCVDGPTDNLLAGAAARFDANRDGGAELDLAHLAARYGTQRVAALGFVLPPPATGTVSVTLSGAAVSATPATASPAVDVALCRTADAALLVQGAQFTAGPARCPAATAPLDPAGVDVTAADGNLGRYVGTSTAAGALYPPVTVPAGTALTYTESLHGRTSPSLGGPVGIVEYVAAAPPAITGRVTSSATGTGVPGTWIAAHAGTCAGQSAASATADGSGSFTLLAPAAGTYCLTSDLLPDGFSAASAPGVHAPGTTAVRLTARGARVTARFSTTAGRPVGGVCAALFRAVSAARSSGPLASQQCAPAVSDQVGWSLPVGVAAQVEVRSAPAGTSFAAPPQAAAVPPDLWSAGLTIRYTSGASPTARVLFVGHDCVLPTYADPTVKVTLSTRKLRTRCGLLDGPDVFVLPGGETVETAPEPGGTVLHLPVTVGRFPRATVTLIDDSYPFPSYRQFPVPVPAGGIVVTLDKGDPQLPDTGGGGPTADPTVPRPAPPNLHTSSSSTGLLGGAGSVNDGGQRGIAAPELTGTAPATPASQGSASTVSTAPIAATRAAPGSAAPSDQVSSSTSPVAPARSTAPSGSAPSGSALRSAVAAGGGGGSPSVVLFAIGGAVLVAIAVGVVLVVRGGGTRGST